jgi:signal transduction histidine kinase
MKNVNYKIELPDNVPHLAISAEARRNIFLVIKEALNNTVKYAQANFVKVTAEFRNSRLEFTVKDNGVGFDIMNTRMFGNGLTNMKKRMEDIDGEFSLDSKIGSGTEITLSLKLSK